MCRQMLFLQNNKKKCVKGVTLRIYLLSKSAVCVYTDSTEMLIDPFFVEDQTLITVKTISHL